MLSAGLSHLDRALLSSSVLLGPCCHQFGLIINLARTLSPPGKFNKVRVASEGYSWADSSRSAMSSQHCLQKPLVFGLLPVALALPPAGRERAANTALSRQPICTPQPNSWHHTCS